MRLSILFFSIGIIGMASPLEALAKSLETPSVQETEKPILLRADDIAYDEEMGITTARGNVEFSDAKQVLQADVLSYNENTKIITATGNVSLTDPEDNIIFADHIEITEDYKDGIIDEFRRLSKQNYRLAAASGKRTGGVRTVLDHGVYSSCELCKTDPTNAPLWQIKAIKITRDEEAMDVDYEDAWLEFYGVPVFYTPYLSHPDPKVTRRSGLLAPAVGISTSLGAFTSIPYYFDISPDQDLTLKPLITTKGGIVFAAEYRKLYEHGNFTFDGSINESRPVGGNQTVTVTKPRRIRGHVKTAGDFDLSTQWRGGFDINRASDATYMRRYRIPENTSIVPDHLTSNAYGEGFYGENYVITKAYVFQPLAADVSQKETPVVLPSVAHSFTGPQRSMGDHFFASSNLLALTREKGTNMRRLAAEGGWTVPYTSPFGDTYTFTALLRSSLYNIDNFAPTSGARKINTTTGRLFPQMGLDWKYPLINDSPSFPLLIEPNVGFVAGTAGGNPIKIPNEDSRDFELDETNLFSMDRFSGWDRIDSGQRANYGVKFQAFPAFLHHAHLFLGQSYSFTRNKAIPFSSGVGEGFSDYVGRLELDPHEYVRFTYRFMYNRKDFRARRNQLTFHVGPPVFNVRGDYLFIAKHATDSAFSGKEQVIGTLSSQITDFWSGYFQTSRDLGKSGGTLTQNLGFRYEDECFTFDIKYKQDFFIDRDVKPENAILFGVAFKTLGQVSTGGGVNPGTAGRSNSEYNREDLIKAPY